MLDDILNRIRSVRILVAGDIMLDRFQYGKVERISPEAPVPVFKPERMAEMAGGAGNAAVNMASLGCKVCLVGRTGNDQAAGRLSALIDEFNVKYRFFKSKDCGTAVKTRLVAGNNHILRIDDEQIMPLDSKIAAFVGESIEDELQDSDVVVLSDYGKGFLTKDLIEMVIKACRRRGKPVIVDPKGADYSRYAGATLVKPNLKEFSGATGKRFDPKSRDFKKDLACAARKLIAKCGIEGLLITLGEHGMLYVPHDRPVAEAVYLPTRAREVFDVSGAGDTTIAALAASLGAGASVSDAMQIANAAAGVVVGKVGTATVSLRELKSGLAWTSGDPNRKILPLGDLAKELEQQRKQGRKIGFTNGCFDCCHLGHLSSLREAKRLCDVLVVAVNSDKWIRRHKGDNRPIQDEATRTELLAALEYVDYVIVFDTDTALPLVRKIRPDVIAKEGYAMSNWPEGRFVRSIGGDAVTLRRVEGYSTTAISKRIAAK